ncbi:MAG: serine hydrolase [Alphaproteobacteria bacterium]|nr:serine hydrolase [Alphaproteobacteria bacterium]
MDKQTFRFIYVVFIIFLGTQSVRAENIPGFSQDGLARIRTVLGREVAKQELPGAVVILARDGKIIFHEAIGNRDGAEPGELTKASVFRLYSMIKPIVTTAAMILVERGKLSLDDPVSKYIPSFGNVRVLHSDGREEEVDRPIMVVDLVQHTSGLTYGSSGRGPVRTMYKSTCFTCAKSLVELADVIAKLPLVHQPGKKWEYGRSIDVLSRVVEIASGMNLDAFLKSEIFRPLDMHSTGFGTRDGRAILLAGGGPVPENPDLHTDSYLLTSAVDYFRFSQMILNGGELDGKRILKNETVQLMMRDQLSRRNIPPGKDNWIDSKWGFGYGFGVYLEEIDKTSKFPAPLGTVFWSSYGGSTFWIDPVNKIVGVFMMALPAKRLKYRRLIRRLVYVGVVDDSRPESVGLTPSDRLTGSALSNHVIGMRVEGRATNGLWAIEMALDGRSKDYWKGKFIGSAVYRIERETLILDGPKLNPPHRECRLYRNPMGNKASLNEYVAICNHGTYPYAASSLQ